MAKDPAKCDVDPVCNMDVSEMHGKFAYDFEDERYYFCSELCKDRFAQEPRKYAKKSKLLGTDSDSALELSAGPKSY